MGQLQFSEEAKRLTEFISDIEQLNDYIKDSTQAILKNVRKFENFDDVEAILDRIVNEAPVVLKSAQAIVANADQILNDARKHNDRAKEIESNAQADADKKISDTEEQCAKAIEDAKKEADATADQIIADAKAQAAGLVEESVITKQAQQYGESIISKAQKEADDYSAKVRGDADSYDENVKDQLNKIVRDYLTRIDEEYTNLAKNVTEQCNSINKEHEEFIKRFRSND